MLACLPTYLLSFCFDVYIPFVCTKHEWSAASIARFSLLRKALVYGIPLCCCWEGRLDGCFLFLEMNGLVDCMSE